jgi:predicted ester cyclase
MQQFLEDAARAHDLIEALLNALEPGARVHAQNGEVVTPQHSLEHSRFAESAFPDMELEVEDAWFPDDRVVARVRIFGTASGKVLFFRPGVKFDVSGAIIGRVTSELRLSEVWSYLNPGFSFSFPPRGVHRRPPPPDGAGEEAARALYQTWLERAEAGDDFVRSLALSLAPDGVVHLPNRDTGGRESLVDLFRRLNRGLRDIEIEIEDVMFDGPRLAAPFRMTGVHHGRIGLFLPTGRVLPSTGAVLARANERGEAAELWLYMAPAYAVTFPPGRPPEG